LTIKQKQNKGFSLIEALVAMGFITIVALSVFTAQAGHFNMVLNSRDRTIATQLAEESLENLMSLRYDDLEVGVFTEPYGLGSDSIPNFPDFRRVLTITKNLVNDQIFEATVSVFWPRAERANSPVVMHTSIVQRPESAL